VDPQNTFAHCSVQVLTALKDMEEAGQVVRMVRVGHMQTAIAKLVDGNGKCLAYGELSFRMRLEHDKREKEFEAALDKWNLEGELFENRTTAEWDELIERIKDGLAKEDADYLWLPEWLGFWKADGKGVEDKELVRAFLSTQGRLIQQLLHAYALAKMQEAGAEPSKTLKFPRWDIGPRFACAVGDNLAADNTLLRLDLRGSAIGHEGARAIAQALRENTTLEYLDLSYNELEDEAAEELASALQVNRHLKHLVLSENCITIDGVRCFMRTITWNLNQTLEEVDLRDNDLEDEVFDAPKQIKC